MYPCPAHGKGKIKASVWDITSRPPPNDDLDLSKLSMDESETGSGNDSSDGIARPPAHSYQLPEGVEPGSVDVLTVIYVLSALHPKEWEQAIHNLYTVSTHAHSTQFDLHLFIPHSIVLFSSYGLSTCRQTPKRLE